MSSQEHLSPKDCLKRFVDDCVRIKDVKSVHALMRFPLFDVDWIIPSIADIYNPELTFDIISHRSFDLVRHHTFLIAAVTHNDIDVVHFLIRDILSTLGDIVAYNSAQVPLIRKPLTTEQTRAIDDSFTKAMFAAVCTDGQHCLRYLVEAKRGDVNPAILRALELGLTRELMVLAKSTTDDGMRVQMLAYAAKYGKIRLRNLILDD